MPYIYILFKSYEIVRVRIDHFLENGKNRYKIGELFQFMCFDEEG
jgi:hypothetical protein